MDVLLGPGMVGEAVKGILRGVGKGALEEYLSSKKRLWKVDGVTKGWAKCVSKGGTFCYVVLRNSGHEAPSYQPLASYDLNSRLIERSFDDWERGTWGDPNCSEEEGGAGPLLDI